MATYNGHKNRNYWNVSLWIGDDEGLYTMARDLVRQCRNRDKAARAMFEALTSAGFTKTPDGEAYSVANIRAAMVGL